MKVEIFEARRRKGRDGRTDGKRGIRMTEWRGGMQNVTWGAKRGEEKAKGETDGKESAARVRPMRGKTLRPHAAELR
jgi:hypothetical protein